MLAQNATYSWTKLFAAFYALTGIAFYVAGIKLKSRVRVVLGFVFLAGGVLVHYSITPYFLFVAGWEAVRALRVGRGPLGDPPRHLVWVVGLNLRIARHAGLDVHRGTGRQLHGGRPRMERRPKRLVDADPACFC